MSAARAAALPAGSLQLHRHKQITEWKSLKFAGLCLRAKSKKPKRGALLRAAPNGRAALPKI